MKPAKSNLYLPISLILITLVFLPNILDSISKSWTCDDAFISFRYARNLVEGKGLVYNPGERVEGYTNFLWTVLIAAGMKLHLDPVKIASILGIISFALTALVFICISWRLFGSQDSFRAFIPLTALCLLLHHDFKVFATGGLETSLFTFLLTSGFAGLIFSKNKYGFLVTGFIFTLALMTRPDGIIFYVVSVIILSLTSSSVPGRIRYFLIPLVVLYIPYQVLRFLYYGYPFPNTYYARSAYLPWWDQGLSYLILYLKSYYILLLLPVMGVISLVRSRGVLKRLAGFPLHLDTTQKAVCLSLLFSLVYSLYVVRIGGDFMFARFFIPVTPFLYFLIEAFAFRILSKRYLIPFALVVCLATFFYWYPAEISSKSNKIVDEKLFYPNSYIAKAKQKGEILKKYLKDTNAQVVISGTQAVLAYYAEFPTVIEGDNGLTDEYLAHLPVNKRTRPGHEKQASMEYLLARGVNFFFIFGGWYHPPSGDLTEIYFEDIRGNIIVYNRNLMRKLKPMTRSDLLTLRTSWMAISRKCHFYPNPSFLRIMSFSKNTISIITRTHFGRMLLLISSAKTKDKEYD